MIPLNRAASLLQACNQYVNECLLQGPGQPADEQLDHLADALVSIEYYLERLAQDPGASSEQVLDRAENSLAELGYAPAVNPVALPDDSPGHPTQRLMPDRQAQSLADAGKSRSACELILLSNPRECPGTGM